MSGGDSLDDWIVFTDLDGTLLDHDSYDFSPALPALRLLKSHRVPVILISSKTFAELSEIASTLALNDQPMIGENGAYIAYPLKWINHWGVDLPRAKRQGDYLFEDFGADYAEIRTILNALRHNNGFRFHGFGDWSVEEIQRNTGLSLADAQRAAQRIASEPILWEDSDAQLAAFKATLESNGLVLLKGGRFYHVMAPGGKDRAMGVLKTRFEQSSGKHYTSVALGDGPNDVAMLTQADIAVVVRNPHSDAIEPAAARVIYTQAAGPAGWNEAIHTLYQESKMS